jgi:hypothetical protein
MAIPPMQKIQAGILSLQWLPLVLGVGTVAVAAVIIYHTKAVGSAGGDKSVSSDYTPL